MQSLIDWSFFLTTTIGAAYGLVLSLIMFLSRRSCMCCLTSVYWLGGICRYGWAIGLSSVKLILCWTVVENPKSVSSLVNTSWCLSKSSLIICFSLLVQFKWEMSGVILDSVAWFPMTSCLSTRVSSFSSVLKNSISVSLL